MLSKNNVNILAMDFIAYLQVLIAVVVLFQRVLENVSISDDVIREFVMQTIQEHDLPPLTGKRRHQTVGSQTSNLSQKRTRIKYDYARAEASVMSDWVGDVPRFPDRQFERTFRIKRHMVDTILNHLARRSSFWTKTVCRAGKETINPYVKLLCGLKMICYGISGNAFIDYHQFGETTSRRCVHQLVVGLVTCPALAGVYLRKPSKSDAYKVTAMHQEVHKMPGMLGSLDVTKIHWKNCPAALKGQYQGREKIATIALECVVDYNLWFWHASFGFPGTMNDINIWERSSLLESMLNGKHKEIDHEFTLDGNTFDKLYYLVDGIYPSLTRFLGPETDPSTKLDGSFKADQEAARKDVERGYGVLKQKFLSLLHPINLHHRDDIYYLAMASILLHNMMVEERVSNGEVEDESFYNTTLSDVDEDGEVDMTLENAGFDQNPIDRHNKFQVVHKRWEELYDYEGSMKLRESVKRHLYTVKYGKDALSYAHMCLDGYCPLSI